MLMMRPLRAFIMPRMTALLVRNTLVRLVSMIDAQSSSFMRISRLSRVMPALLTRIEIGPNSLAIPSDRKSTRLNSSHSQISYAVFCLKKKKKKEKYIDRHRARQQLLKDSER